MATYKEMYRRALLLSEDEKKTRFGSNLMKAWEYLSDSSPFPNQEECFALLMDYLSVFVSADKVCCEEEYDLFVDSLGLEKISFDDFYALTNFGRSRESIAKAFELLDACPKSIDDALLQCGLIMLASDGTITQDEQILFEHFYDSRG